ncbi:carbamoyltransferase [Bradyrhizobium japonicum]
MNILGINSVYHESAAAVVVDGIVEAACEEERFNRHKHAKPADVCNPHEMPEEAIRSCLRQAGIEAGDVEAVAYSFSPKERRKKFAPDPLSVPGQWGDIHGERTFQSRLDEVAGAVSRVLKRDATDILHFVPHHLAHAASSYYPSGFDAAAILVVDGIGESACSTLACAEGDSIRILEEIEYPHSIGFLWEKISTYLGFSEYDACKTMGLAAYGNPMTFADQFASLIAVGEEGYAVDAEKMRFRLPDFSGLESAFGVERNLSGVLQTHHADVAAALQSATDAAVTALLRRLRRLVPFDQLCVAGGVGLNCVTNALINDGRRYREIYIPPAPHDSGTAIGAALLLHHATVRGRRDLNTPTPYLGPEFGDQEIISALNEVGLKPRRSGSVAKEAASMIAEGRVVAWFQGRMEFGPRALGNRSLLADPRRPEMRQVLNGKVKHREDFRPFAPSVLAEYAEEWFELGTPSISHEYMLFACPARSDGRDRIPAVLHCDGTARLQIVRQASNPLFHEVISSFHKMTGVPLVLNTSFNDSEPIVCTPAQAVATFQKTKIDALFIGNFVVTREAAP